MKNLDMSIDPRGHRPPLRLAFLLAALLLSHAPAWSQTSANEILGAHFYEPELIQRFEKVLNLTPDQQRYLQTEMSGAVARLTELQAQIKGQVERLAPMISSTVVEEDPVLAQSEKILQLERAMKLAQLKVLIRVNNILTASQKTKMKEIQQQVLGLQEKWAGVMQRLQQRQSAGSDLSDYEPLKKEYETAIKEGAIERAGAVLDRTLQKLQAPPPAKPAPGHSPMKTAPRVGWLGEATYRVEERHLIDFAEQGMPAVLCTPALVGFLERTAREALLPCLEPDENSVGVELDLKHLAPTPLGGMVTCRARVVHVDGRRITFHVEARDEQELIARGSHQRQIVRVDRLAKAVAAKLKSEKPPSR
jgi:fluoroacetyl-CoA thioesterase